MIHEIIRLSTEKTTLKTYILDNYDSFSKNKLHPFVLICPGGGFEHLSDRESEPVALKLNSLGFSAAILNYSLAPMKFGDALKDLTEAVSYIRKNSQLWNIDTNKIIVGGFSAGGHLAASLGCFWNSEFLKELTNHTPEEIKPNYMLLCYPVITSDEKFSHKGSIANVLGTDFSNLKQEDKDSLLKKVSLEHNVSNDFPPTFMWHTFADESVPAENSLKFANALRQHNIDFEYHLFSRGCHGLALATEISSKSDNSTVEKECSVWPELFYNWFIEK